MSDRAASFATQTTIDRGQIASAAASCKIDTDEIANAKRAVSGSSRAIEREDHFARVDAQRASSTRHERSTPTLLDDNGPPGIAHTRNLLDSSRIRKI
jgi:hypothetical protein